MTPFTDELGTILDGIRQPAWAVDADRLVSCANGMAAEFMGYGCPSDLVGIHGKPTEYTEIRSRERAIPLAPSCGHGTLTHASGSFIPVEWFEFPLLRSGDATVYILRTGSTTRPSPPEPVHRVSAVQPTVDRHQSIAASLQHGAQERLVSLLLRLRLARRHLDEGVWAAELLDSAVDDAEAALAHVREATGELYPGVLRLRGLPAALRVLAGQWPVPVVVSDNLRERLPDVVEMAIYFMVREALGRAVHRCRASRVRVVTELGVDLVVRVTDDGEALGAGPDSSSLAAAADWVCALDGNLSVRRTAGEETTVRAVVPVRPRSRTEPMLTGM